MAQAGVPAPHNQTTINSVWLFLRRGLAGAAVRRRKWQPGGSAEHFALRRGEYISEAFRVDDLFALFRRHVAQVADRSGYHASAIGRKLLHLPENSPSLLLLLRGQVLPGFHVAQNALLPLGRQAGKMLQPLPQPLLLLRRQSPESGIAL